MEVFINMFCPNSSRTTLGMGPKCIPTLKKSGSDGYGGTWTLCEWHYFLLEDCLMWDESKKRKKAGVKRIGFNAKFSSTFWKSTQGPYIHSENFWFWLQQSFNSFRPLNAHFLLYAILQFCCKLVSLVFSSCCSQLSLTQGMQRLSCSFEIIWKFFYSIKCECLG